MHAAGFDVMIETKTSGDLYAAGASVTLRGAVAQDLTAFGFSVRSAPSNKTSGNARLMGQTLTIDGPVGGALTAFGYEVILNSRIDGDVLIMAEKITYGPDAVIVGKLTYASPNEMDPPVRVIDAARVTYEKMSRMDAVIAARESWDRTEYPGMPGYGTMFAGFLISLAFFLIVGAMFLTFLPKPVERLRASICDRPGTTFLIGVVGLSVLFGMVPITAMTIVGLPFVPIVILVTVLVWTLGYALAAYAVGLRIWQAFGGTTTPTRTASLIALGVAVVAVAILNFIPFIGWVVNFTLVLLGIGAMTNMLLRWLMGTKPAQDAAKPAAKAAAKPASKT
jgi:hypothetical protein